MTFLSQSTHCTLYESIVLLLRVSEEASRQERRHTRLPGNWEEGSVCSITITQAHSLNMLTSTLPLHGDLLVVSCLCGQSPNVLWLSKFFCNQDVSLNVYTCWLSLQAESLRNLPHSKTHTPPFFLDMMFQLLSRVGMNMSASSKLRQLQLQSREVADRQNLPLRSSAERSMLLLPPYSDVLLMWFALQTMFPFITQPQSHEGVAALLLLDWLRGNSVMSSSAQVSHASEPPLRGDFWVATCRGNKTNFNIC